MINTETILIIIGSLFILIGIAGSIKMKDGEVFIKSSSARVILFIIGTVLLTLGIIKSFPNPDTDVNRPLDCTNCITTPLNKEKVGNTTIVKGNYSEINNDLWVIVWPEQGGNTGWPQSDDALNGKPAYKSNGKWSVHCNFGGPPQKYDIALYSASEEASEILSTTISEWASVDDYPGFNINDLPEGLDELDRITVIKK